jgi:hypothetical protein
MVLMKYVFKSENVNNENAKETRIWPLDCSYSTKSGLTSIKHEKQIKCAINLHCHVLLGWQPTLSKLTKSYTWKHAHKFQRNKQCGWQQVYDFIVFALNLDSCNLQVNTFCSTKNEIPISHFKNKPSKHQNIWTQFILIRFQSQTKSSKRKLDIL